MTCKSISKLEFWHRNLQCLYYIAVTRRVYSLIPFIARKCFISEFLRHR